jgi:hypothetical protein
MAARISSSCAVVPVRVPMQHTPVLSYSRAVGLRNWADKVARRDGVQAQIIKGSSRLELLVDSVCQSTNERHLAMSDSDIATQ